MKVEIEFTDAQLGVIAGLVAEKLRGAVGAAVPRSGAATVEEAAEFLQVSTDSIYRMVRCGSLGRVPGLSVVRIPWRVLEAMNGNDGKHGNDDFSKD